MGKGQNNKTTQTTKASPWGPISGDLKDAFSDARGVYDRGAPGFFPGNTVAGMSGFSRDSLNAMANRAAAGSPLTGMAQDQTMRTMRGDYLDPASNPFLQGAISTATRPVTEAFRDVVMPGIDSTFSAAGRFGSGAQLGAYSDAQQDMARGVGDIATNMAFNNYGMERGNQMQAMGMAPGLAMGDYQDISMLGLAGQGMEGYDQRQIDADRERYNYESNKDMNWLSNYIGLLGGAPPPTTTGTIKTPAPNPFVSALGLGLQGASMLGGMPMGGFGLGGSPPFNPMMVGGFY